MSKITLSGNLSGTGTFTLASPDSNTDRTLNLPDAGGTVVLDTATQTLTNKTIQSSTIQGGALTLATAVASTSGTSIDFTSIPSWVKRITVMFSGVSTNGTSGFAIQLGTSGGVETTGYLSGCSYAQAGNLSSAQNSTTSLLCAFATGAALTNAGSVSISLVGSNAWVSSGTICTSTTYNYFSGGTKTLSDTLTQVRITTVNGTDTFDAGTINIMYEG